MNLKNHLLAKIIWGFFAILVFSACNTKHKKASTNTDHLFFVSVATFDDPNIVSFTQKPRADFELLKALSNSGIAAQNQTILIDSQAIRADVLKKFTAAVAAVADNERLIFYFAGHGYAQEGTVYLSPYDMNESNIAGSGLDAIELFSILESHFRGDQILFFGDFCNSGILGELTRNLKKIRPELSLDAFSSAHRYSYSTGSWTFTNSVLEMWKGSSYFDMNGDKFISYDEFAKQVKNIMNQEELQLSDHFISTMGSILSHVQSDDFSKHESSKDLTYSVAGKSVGAKVRVQWDSDWVPAIIVDENDDYRRIHYEDRRQDWDEWIHVSKLNIIDSN